MKRTVRVSAAVLMAASLVFAAVPAAFGAEGTASNADDALWGFSPLARLLQQDAETDAVDQGVSLWTFAVGDARSSNSAPFNLKKAKVSGVKASYTYTGKAIKPKPVLKLGGKKVPKSAYLVTYSHNKSVGEALAVVSAKKPNKGTFTIKFKIVPRATKLKKLKAAGNSIVVTWKRRFKQVSGYQIAYSTKKSMKSVVKKKVKGAKKRKLTIKGLMPGKTYYVAIRTTKGSMRSPWSSPRKFKLPKLGRKDLTKLLDKASAKNKGTKKLKVYNSAYKVKKAKAGKKLLKYIKKLRKNYRVNIAMVDVTTGATLTYSPNRSMYSASCLKGPYVASLNKWVPSSRKSSAGTMRETIVWSNNDTYASLRSTYGSESMRKMHVYSGVSTDQYYIMYHWLSTKDLAKLWVGTYWYFYKSTNKNSKWARSLYTHGYQSFIYRGLKGKWKVHAKPGWYPGEGKDVQNDAGVVMAKVNGKSRPYVLACMTSLCDEHPKLRKLVRLIDAVHTDMVKGA